MKYILVIALLTLSAPACFSAVLNVVTSSADFADIAQVIGGDRVQARSLIKGNADLHSIEPRPSMVMAVRGADLFIRVGMDLDLWAQSLVEASKNKRLLSGGEGNLDVSAGVEKLEVPAGKVDMGMGDLHIYGNPHYWLDPQNGIRIAAQIRDRLSMLMPESKSFFEKNYSELAERISNSMRESMEILKPYAGLKVLSYHKSLLYFAKRFGLSVIDQLEPKPGIPPTPSHLKELEEKIKGEGVRLILQESWFSLDAAKSVSRNTGVKAIMICTSVGGTPEVKHYEDIFVYNAMKIAESLK